MKYVKTFEEFQFNYGKLLFADPDSIGIQASRRGRKYYNYLGGDINNIERNTPQEENLFQTIGAYLVNQDAIQDMSPLKKLLALKDKFPEKLDPLKDPSPLSKKKYIYRGATIPTEELIEMVIASKSQYKDKWSSLSVKAKGRNVTSTTSRGALSFSFKSNIAFAFATNPSKKASFLESLDKRFPVVLQCAVNTLSDKLLFSPSFINAINGYGEAETFYFDTTVPCDIIIVPSPMEFENLGSPSNILSAIKKGFFPPMLEKLMRSTGYTNIKN